MSRPILTQPPRGLTLTEELEKLEQQITLTLQEIDSNFSKAHRIVTSSILPIVEDYAKHSNDVWEGSKVGYQAQSSVRRLILASSGNNSSRPLPTSRYRDTKRTPTRTTRKPTLHSPSKRRQITMRALSPERVRTMTRRSSAQNRQHK